MNATATRPATANQIALIRVLLDELTAVDATAGQGWRESLNRLRERKAFDFSAASSSIEQIKIAKRDAKANAQVIPKAKVVLPDVPAGRYAVEIDGTVKFYKIEVSDSGFVTGYVQASDDLHRLPFSALKGVLAKIVEVTPLEASKAYGREIGRCGNCHRTLTDPTSIAAGIGPKCAAGLSA